MNPRFEKLQPYPFERYRELLTGVQANSAYALINLSIGEPKYPTPDVIRDAIVADLDGLAKYPGTAGSLPLREAIADWLEQRFKPCSIDPQGEVLPVLGTREALFAIAQTVLDPDGDDIVVCPNPFYQIYEGAALLGGASVQYVKSTPNGSMTAAWGDIPEACWQRTRLVYVCSPGNPTGSIISIDEWKLLFELSDKYNFFIVADECYSELYRSDRPAPIGCLQAAAQLGRDKTRLAAFGSLSKRSNAPGLRSGYVAGDRALIGEFLKFRTYQGGAMSPTVQSASIAAWRDEAHVEDNRRRYDETFDAVVPLLSDVMRVERPDAGFYLWAQVPDGDDVEFSRALFQQYNVRVLPGQYLSRDVDGENPGVGRIRIALVDKTEQCVEAAKRIRAFCQQ